MRRNDSPDRALVLVGVATRVLIVLLSVELALFALDYLIVHREIVDNRDLQNLFDITREDTIGTWVSVAQYLLLACVAWLIRLRVRDGSAPGRRAAG